MSKSSNTSRNMTFGVEKITPEKAAEYLKANAGNRKIIQSNLRSLVSAIEGGYFKNTGHGIIFDNTGALRDGQHRLMAVVEAGIPVDMVVTRGADPDGFMVLDTGARRSAGQNLAILGTKNANIVAAAARAVIAYDNGVSFSTKGDNYLVAKEVEGCEELYQEIAAMSVMCSKETGISPSVIASVGYIASRGGSSERFAEFCEKLGSGIGLNTGDPRVALRRLSLKRNSRDRWSRDYIFSVVAQAWNSYIGCTPMKSVRAYKQETGSYKRPEVTSAHDPLYQADPEAFFVIPR